MIERVSVIGLGSWGSALAQHLATNGHDVTCWSRSKESLQSMDAARRHPRWKDDVILHDKISFSSDLTAVAAAKYLVLAVPSKAILQVLDALGARTDVIFVSAIKGIEPATELTPLQLLEQKQPGCKSAVISGPSFAADVVRGRPVSLVAASQDEATTAKVAKLFASPTMRVYLSKDPLGVELGGIVKNVIAIAAGVSDALGYGPSARAGLITRGLAEMSRLAVALGADERTLSGLSGLGDLIMTATEDQSRNRTVGLRLGRGEKLADILSTLGSEAEGTTAAPHVLNLGRRLGIELPITERVVRLLSGDLEPKALATELLSRPLKAEFS